MKTLTGGIVLALACAGIAAGGASANAYREKGKTVKVADSTMVVTPQRDWNRLDVKPGKRAETWTLDGEQLNDVTFYAAIEPGEPLLRDHKRAPLPRFSASTLLAEVPELLETNYRTSRNTAAFMMTEAKPAQFLGQPGVHFSYEYTDAEGLPKKGEARAVVVAGKLYMATFDAPRHHFFDRTIEDYRSLMTSATLAP